MRITASLNAVVAENMLRSKRFKTTIRFSESRGGMLLKESYGDGSSYCESCLLHGVSYSKGRCAECNAGQRQVPALQKHSSGPGLP